MSWFTNQRGCGLCVNNKSSVHCNSLPSPRKRLHQINMVYFRALTCELIYTNLVFTHPYNCLNTCKFIHDPSQPLSFIFKMMPLIVTVIPEHRFLWNDTHLFQIINTILKSKYYFKSYWLTIWGWTESRASWYTDSVPGAGFFFFPPSNCSGSSLLCTGFLELQKSGATLCCSLRWLLLLWNTSSRYAGFRGCSALASGIFPDQGKTRVPCTGRQILIHCTTREVPTGTVPSTLQVLTLVILTSTPSGSCHPHWQMRKLAWRDGGTCPGSHSSIWKSWDLNSDSLAPESLLITTALWVHCEEGPQKSSCVHTLSKPINHAATSAPAYGPTFPNKLAQSYDHLLLA